MANKRTHTTNSSTNLPPVEPGLAAEETDEELDAEADERPAQPVRPRPRVTGAQPKVAAQTASAESLTRNVLFCLGGLILGFSLGFFLANKMSVEPRPQSAAARAPHEADSTAPPLDPSQATDKLPPGHPDIGSMNGPIGSEGANSPAATSADAQQAMAEADAKPKDFDAQMIAATTFYEAKDYQKAELYLQRALSLKPKDTKALTGMGDTKYDKGDFASAAEYYQRVLAIEPQNADVQTDLGNTFYQRQPPDYARAIKEYRKALAINPKHEKALQNLAAAALLLKDKATARTALDQLAAVNPNNPALAGLRENLNAHQ
jgi:tetratricopeptide (TPR) repeat protein